MGLETGGDGRGVMKGFVTLSATDFFSPKRVSGKTKMQCPLSPKIHGHPASSLSVRLSLPGSPFSCNGLITLNLLCTFSWTEHTNNLLRKRLPSKAYAFPFPLQKQRGKLVFCLHTRSDSFPNEWWRQSGHCSRESLHFKSSKRVLGLRVGLYCMIPWSFTAVWYVLFRVIQQPY